MAYTQITGNNTTFKVNVQWTFTTAAAERKNLLIKPVNNSALTFQSTVTLPTTGTFTLVNIRGMRTDSSVSYQNSSTRMNIGLGGRWNNAWSGNASNAGWIGFNKNSSNWGTANTWSAKNINTFGGNNIQSVATSKSFNLQTYSSSQSVINKWFNTNLNCGVAATRTYSKDNTNWQSSATFTGLTPNTNYTLYMKTVTTTGSGNSATNYDSISLKTPCAAPSNLKCSLTDEAYSTAYIVKAEATGDTNADITNIEIFHRKKGTTSFNQSSIVDNNGEAILNYFIEEADEIECCIAATNHGGTTYTMSIPDDYQEVEYIQTSGTQCINTVYKFGCDSSIHCHFAFVGTPTAQTRIFGNREGNNDNTGGFSADMYVNSAYGISWQCCDGTGDNTYQATKAYWDNLVHDYRIDSYYNDNQGCAAVGNMAWATMPASIIRSNSESTRNLFLGCENYFGTPSNFATGKYYKTCILENGYPVKLFVPCYRKSDNVIGMYDPIQKNFYTNYGTGTFTKGENVYTASTTFWTQNPAIWVKTANGWQKRVHLWYKYENNWEKNGEYNSDGAAGAKVLSSAFASGGGYTRLEYIQSNNFTNYITIPKTANTEIGFKIKAELTERSTASWSPHLISSGATDKSLWYVPMSTDTIFYFNGYTNLTEVLPLGIPTIVTFKPEKCYGQYQYVYNDELVSNNFVYRKGNNIPTGTSITLMNYPDDTSGQYGFKGKIYYCILYENGRIVHYLIPAKNSSNIVGLYDIKTDIFYPNEGSGTFTAGTTVNDASIWWEALDH